MASQAKLDTTYHDRRLARRLKKDPEFRAEFERQRAVIADLVEERRSIRIPP